jgi:hypothetical protein
MAETNNSMATDDDSKPMGRPPMYTAELGATVCQRIAEGESLRQVCRDDAMPSMTTVMKWARENDNFAQQYTRAREALLEHHAEEILEIADDGSNDWISRETKGGRLERVLDEEHVRRSQLRVDARKWLLSKLAPKKYGDKLELAGTLNHNHSNADEMTDAELEALARGGRAAPAEPETSAD